MPPVPAHAFVSRLGAPVDRPRFRPDIEGLRGVAVLLVVAYHAAVPGVGGGYVGVDVFFVLSGYLITWLLVHEVERTGTVDFAAFYARRARRLLPAMALLLVAVAGFAALAYAPVEQAVIAKTALATAAYVSNLHFASGATDYLGADAEADPLLHTWSLAVEEQFYLGWPLLVLVLLVGLRPRGGGLDRRRLLVGLAVVAALSFGLSLYLMGSLRAHWAFFSSPTRAWEFAVGGLGVLLPRLGGARPGTAPAGPEAGRLVGWLGLAAIVVAGVAFTSRTPFPGWAALLPTLGTVLVLRVGAASGAEGTTLGRLLGWRPLQEAGRLSYSWYLWHWPVLVFAAGLSQGRIEDLPPLLRLTLVGLSLALAEASYRFVENPLRHHRGVASAPRRGLALGAALTVAGVGLAIGWGVAARAAARPYARVVEDVARLDCIGGVPGTDLRTCTLGDSASATTVVLYGDSHAHQWLPAVEAVAVERGWRLETILKAACPAVDATRVLDGQRHVACDTWRAASLDRLDALAPDLVVVSTMEAIYNDLDRAEWGLGTDRLIARLAASGRPVLLLRDTPSPLFDVPACLSRGRWGRGPTCTFDPADTQTEGVYALQQKAAAEHPRVTVADLNGVVCPAAPCATVRGDSMIVWRDSHHLTATFVRTLAPALGDAVDDALGR